MRCCTLDFGNCFPVIRDKSIHLWAIILDIIDTKTHEKKRWRSINSSVNLFFSCADGDTDLGGEVGWRQPFIGRAALDDRIPQDDHVLKPFGHFTVVKGVIFHCDDLLLFLSEIAGKIFDFSGWEICRRFGFHLSEQINIRCNRFAVFRRAVMYKNPAWQIK